MTKSKYKNTFKIGIVVVVCCALLFGGLLIADIAAKVQYEQRIKNLKSIAATVVKAESTGTPNEQAIEMTYDIDGVTYTRSMTAKASFAVGDTVDLLYNPQAPMLITLPQTEDGVSAKVIVGLVGLVASAVSLVVFLKQKSRFLLVQE